jgi:MerR family mercuric resistance operon transcriptional regulator
MRNQESVLRAIECHHRFGAFSGVLWHAREIRIRLALSVERGQPTCGEVRELAAGHLGEVRAKIADLRSMERVLADAVRRCDAGERPGCSLIAALWAE